MKILLTGCSGQLGASLALQLRKIAEVVAPTHADMDLAKPDQLRDFIRRQQPQLIINTAAYTAVDLAESDPDMVMCVNAQAPAIMAEEAQRLGAALIHYSTDYVFDGAHHRPYDESAATAPLNAYGRSKLNAEQQIANLCECHWILRCSWIYSSEGSNFLRTFWRLAQEREQLQVVDDQIGAPTWASSIAIATAAMLRQAMLADDGWPQYIRSTRGIYHMAATGSTSWYGMAQHILQRMLQAGLPVRLAPAQLLPISSSNYLTAAQRPLNSRLQTDKLEQIFRLRLPNWRDDLDSCIATLLKIAPN